MKLHPIDSDNRNTRRRTVEHNQREADTQLWLEEEEEEWFRRQEEDEEERLRQEDEVWRMYKEDDEFSDDE